MVNENYEQLVRNNNRGSYLKDANHRAKNDNYNTDDLAGPVMRNEEQIRKHTH